MNKALEILRRTTWIRPEGLAKGMRPPRIASRTIEHGLLVYRDSDGNALGFADPADHQELLDYIENGESKPPETAR